MGRWFKQMRDRKRIYAITFGWAVGLAAILLFSLQGPATGSKVPDDESVAVGAQYDSTHVYVAPRDLDAFVDSFAATFDGQPSKRSVTNVLPVPSSTELQSVTTPVGLVSIFAYQTPLPFPFGEERTGYLVTDMDQALNAARATGAEVIVEPFKDPVGIDAVIQWPGGVKMQLYSHFTPPKYAPLATIPDNRVYVSGDQADNFVNGFVRFSHGKVVADDKRADAGEIGRAGETYRRIRIESLFGDMQVMVTDGHLPYPFGREITGYRVQDLGATLQKAKVAGVKILSPPYSTHDRTTAIIQFPGGYIGEVHSLTAR
jgi:predicted enzyme related to lactoylglutathione lyase